VSGIRVGDRIHDHAAGHTRSDSIRKSGTGIEKAGSRARSAGNSYADRGLAQGRSRACRGWLRGWWCQKFDDFDAVGIRVIAKLLDCPHRHVVIGIDAGERIIAPAVRTVLVGWVVVEEAEIANVRRINRAEGVACHSSGDAGIEPKVCARRAKPKGSVSLPRHDD